MDKMRRDKKRQKFEKEETFDPCLRTTEYFEILSMLKGIKRGSGIQHRSLYPSEFVLHSILRCIMIPLLSPFLLQLKFDLVHPYHHRLFRTRTYWKLWCCFLVLIILWQNRGSSSRHCPISKLCIIICGVDLQRISNKFVMYFNDYASGEH